MMCSKAGTKQKVGSCPTYAVKSVVGHSDLQCAAGGAPCLDPHSREHVKHGLSRTAPPPTNDRLCSVEPHQ
ncbi:MAG: hypothetical protein WDW36_009465 [Sanguina aurantia]